MKSSIVLFSGAVALLKLNAQFCGDLPSEITWTALAPFITSCQPGASCYNDGTEDQCYSDCPPVPIGLIQRGADGPAINGVCVKETACYWLNDENQCFPLIPTCPTVPKDVNWTASGPAINQLCPPETTCYSQGNMDQCFLDVAPSSEEPATLVSQTLSCDSWKKANVCKTHQECSKSFPTC